MFSTYVGASVPVYSCATMARMLDRFNDELMAICRVEGVPCYDLADAVGHNPEWFVDDVHFTEAG